MVMPSSSSHGTGGGGDTPKSVYAANECRRMAAEAVLSSIEAAKCTCHNCQVLEILLVMQAHVYVASMKAYQGDTSILTETFNAIKDIQRNHIHDEESI